MILASAIKGKIIVKLRYKDYPIEYINVISGKVYDNKLHIIQRYSNKEIACIDLDDISYWKYEKRYIE